MPTWTTLVDEDFTGETENTPLQDVNGGTGFDQLFVLNSSNELRVNASNQVKRQGFSQFAVYKIDTAGVQDVQACECSIEGASAAPNRGVGVWFQGAGADQNDWSGYYCGWENSPNALRLIRKDSDATSTQTTLASYALSGSPVGIVARIEINADASSIKIFEDGTERIDHDDSAAGTAKGVPGIVSSANTLDPMFDNFKAEHEAAGGGAFPNELFKTKPNSLLRM